MHIHYVLLEYWNELQYPFVRETKENVLSDVHDGSIVKELMKPGNFLAVPEHAALMMNTDGVQPFKSSKHSMWPVYFSVRNLPPEIRFNEKFQIIAGVWFGPKKPDMSLFLKPTIKKLNHIMYNGIEVDTPIGIKQVKAIVLLGIFDLPAKATVVNMKQFNGEYGCLYCVDSGEVLHRSVRVYPPSAPHHPRTEQDIIESAAKAEAQGSAVFGIKGHSVLYGVISLPYGIPIDYMHSVLEGVVKSLMVFWFDPKYHDQPYSLRPYLQEIDKMLSRIKPPHEFRRSPRSIATTSKYWKASELRAFILFYSLPILQSFFQDSYIHHLALLVCSLHILLSDCAEEHHILQAQAYLEEFYNLLPTLYSTSLCTMNMHSLIHLVSFTKLWGPLWTHSAFSYESMNGSMTKQLQGTRTILQHVILRTKMKQYFDLKESKTNDILHVTGQDCCPSITGRISLEALPPELDNILHTSNTVQTKPTYTTFKKLKFKNNIFYCGDICTGSRDSSICTYRNPDGHVCFGKIKLFLLAPEPHAFIEQFQDTNDGIYSTCNHLNIVNNFFHKVKKLSVSSQMVLVPADLILSKCVLVPIKGEEYNYIITQPNTYERH